MGVGSCNLEMACFGEDSGLLADRLREGLREFGWSADGR